MKTFLFCNLPRKYYDKAYKDLAKNHDKEALKGILSHDGTRKMMLLYDEEGILSTNEINTLVRNARAFSLSIGLIME